MTDRAVTPVLGIVLLLGLTAVAALSLLVVGASVLGGPQAAAETSQAERSLGQFAATADDLASSGGGEAPFTVLGSDRAALATDPDAGRYEVRVDRGGSTEVLTDGSLGQYRYVGPDGTVLAYQGGGVFRKDRSGEARVVTSPEFHYRARPEPTLTLPVVRVGGASTDAAPASGRMRVAEPRRIYPRDPAHRNPLQSGTVYIQIRSEFCEGWEQFFRERTDGALAETCEDTGETVPGEVLVQLTVPFSFDGTDGNALIARDLDGNGDVHGPREVGPHSYPSASGVVEARVEDCEDGDGQPLTTAVTGPGLYCSLSAPMTGDYVFDTSGGDVEVVVNETVDPDEIDVVGDGNVTIFANDHVMQTPGDRLGNPAHPERLRFLVHSDARVGNSPASCGGGPPGGPPGGGNLDVYGLVYAPNSEVGFAGNVDIHGGVVADDVCLRSASAEIHHEPAVSSVSMEFDQGGEPFYYLHVSETDVTVVD